jgi:hypothetical protein
MVSRFFPTKHIADVGTFQDAGLLVNDPVATAFSEAAIIYPSTPIDLILSLGTGKIPKAEYAQSLKVAAAPLRAPFRVRDLVWEKSRDQQVRQVFAHHPRYHRLDHEVDRDYGLDNVGHMLALKSAVENDASLSEPINRVAGYAVASLFYFELVGLPKRSHTKFMGSGHILCSVLGKDPEFGTLLTQLSSSRAQFYLNGVPLNGIWTDQGFLDGDGNFRKRVDFKIEDHISIVMRIGDRSVDIYEISGLPSTISNLIQAQGLKVYFGNRGHQKRKRSVCNNQHPAGRKRIRIESH